MAVPVFPLVLGLVGAAVSVCATWYATLSKPDRDKVNRATVYAAQRKFGKTADTLTGDEAEVVVAEVMQQVGGPLPA